MGPKKMLILLAIGFVAVAALAVFVLVVERRAPTTDDAMKERGLIFKYEDKQNRTIPDVATKLAIQRGDQTTVLEKAGGRDWRLSKPVDARADRSKVLAILTDLKNLRIESVVKPEEGKPLDPETFGLKEPRVKATFWIGDQSHELAIGKEAKGARSYEKKAYVQVAGQAPIYVVDNPVVEKLDKAPDDFRDKNVFERARDPERAKALRLITEAQTLALEKAKRDWELKAPVTDLADKSKVQGLLTKARNLEVEKFVSEDTSKLGDYGLDKPQLTCELKADDGTSLTLLVGTKSKDDEKQLHAKRGEEPSIFTIKADFLKDMDVKPDDVREKKVVPALDEDDVTRVEIARGEAAWAVARKNKDDDWKLLQPREAKADKTAVGDFLRDVKRLRVARWVDDPKDPAHEMLQKPEAVLTVLREPEGKVGVEKKPPVKLSLSAPVKTEEEEGRYVQRNGQAILLFVSARKPEDSASYEEKDSVESLGDLAESLGKGYLDLFDRTVFSFKDTDVTKLVIERDGQKLTCEKDGDAWKLVEPVKLDADKGNVATILSALDSLQADEYVAESPKDLKPYGLDKPALRLAATITEEVKEEKDEEEKDEGEEKPDEKKDEAKKDEKKEPEKKTYTKALLLSRKIDGTTYGMAEGGSLVFKLKSWDITSLHAEPISTTIADFPDTDATSLTVAHRGKPEIVLDKKDDTWKLTKPKEADADQEAVKKALDALHDLRTRRFLDYDATDEALKAYGLDPAEAVVTVKVKDKPDVVLHLGKPVPDEKDEPGSYARKPDSKQVFLMAKTKVDDVAKDLKGFEKQPEPKPEDKKKEGGAEEKEEGEKKPEAEDKPDEK